MASFCFNTDSSEEFVLRPNLTLKGITPATLKDFSTDFIFDGTCYKSLSDISAPNPHTGEYKQKGYIFAVSLASYRFVFIFLSLRFVFFAIKSISSDKTFTVLSSTS